MTNPQDSYVPYVPSGPPPPMRGHGQPYALPPVQQRKKGISTGAVIAVILASVFVLCGVVGVVGAISGGDGTDSETSSGTVGATTGDTEGRAQTAKVARIGQPARDGQFEFTATKVQCAIAKVGNQYLGKTAQGQFCLVTMTVQNIGKEPRTFADSNQKAFNATGAELAADTEAGLYANQENAGFLNDINPGNKITVVMVFDVPKGTKLTKVELHDSPFSGGTTVDLV